MSIKTKQAGKHKRPLMHRTQQAQKKLEDGEVVEEVEEDAADEEPEEGDVNEELEEGELKETRQEKEALLEKVLEEQLLDEPKKSKKRKLIASLRREYKRATNFVLCWLELVARVLDIPIPTKKKGIPVFEAIVD